MGFKINHRKRLAKAFGLSLDEVNELLQRMNGYFRKNGIDNEEIAKSFFILNDIWCGYTNSYLEYLVILR